jgi:periplasmic copper chaperone A
VGNIKGLSIFAWSLASLYITVARAAELNVTDAYVQLAPPGAKAYAAYMTLTNPHAESVTITHVAADCCAMAMFHQTRTEQGQATMVHLAELKIMPAERLVMVPGEMHLMLMGVKQPLSLGDSVSVTLNLSDGSSQGIDMPVRRADD